MESATLEIDTPERALAQAPGWVPVPSRPQPITRPPGRPTLYSLELAQRIGIAIAGGASVRKVCAQPWAPVRQTFYHWRAQHPEFASLYDLATEMRIHALMDEIIEIADDASRDFVWKERRDASGNLVRIAVLNPAAIEAAKLRIDVRKWIIERMRPRKYGRQARNPQPITIQTQAARERVQQLRGQASPGSAEQYAHARTRVEPAGEYANGVVIAHP